MRTALELLRSFAGGTLGALGTVVTTVYAMQIADPTLDPILMAMQPGEHTKHLWGLIVALFGGGTTGHLAQHSKVPKTLTQILRERPSRSERKLAKAKAQAEIALSKRIAEADKEIAMAGSIRLAQLSPHFATHEFACRCCGEVQTSADLLQVLEQLRAKACTHLGKETPVRITSGYRCPRHNASLPNSSPDSQHLRGTAADVQIDGIDPSTVATWAREILGERGGVGRYNGFTHIDVRTQKVDWTG